MKGYCSLKALKLISSLDLLDLLHDERLVDVWDDTTSSDSCLDERVQLFVASDGELQVSWRYSLDLKIFAGVSCKLDRKSVV